jgi:hypothetical protein
MGMLGDFLSDLLILVTFAVVCSQMHSLSKNPKRC